MSDDVEYLHLKYYRVDPSKLIMSSSAPFRCRPIGRAASPPTWACYEQIPYDDDYSESGSESCSEDDEDYHNSSDDNDNINDSDIEEQDGERPSDDSNDLDMDIDEEGADKTEGGEIKRPVENRKDVKGKQKATEAEPVPEPPKKHRRRPRQRHHVFTLRPILTIQRSQGFVWNQDLFVPPYIKDRYVASTSPPNSGFVSTSVSSTNSALNEYEVEVVEIRVKEGEGIP
ncbi:hypothetical protein GYMLUDRAFT_59675 [Collybiopsis luxurians FD-317 M1]|uniref:Uncharacterized protein n=1 Tax=Collybiopsis luxurians FD-317 M1 TaxID=944289 RepID=A0A0D0CVX3_9AGAR|nr:hypothetical protein GYMLUDRAFT_59675 [Collybiopsis luxurians FD-317 M1]